MDFSWLALIFLGARSLAVIFAGQTLLIAISALLTSLVLTFKERDGLV